MVTTNDNAHRNLYMVWAADPDAACEQVNRVMGLNNAAALAPLSDEQLGHFKVQPGQPFLFTTTAVETGQVTSSQLT
jgi:hypothetical protein